MKMENMTEERIDKVIDSAFLEINEYPAYSSQLASNLAAFKTARDHCIEIFKSSRVLYTLWIVNSGV